jgi:hypothetical protein
MGTVEVYNFLDGKNLCNIFANLIVNKINKDVPNANTEITVINVRNFFIVRGQTSSGTLINVANVFTDFLNEYDEELSKKVRVIDVIKYSSEFEVNNMNLSYHYNKVNGDRLNKIQEFVDGHCKNGLYFNLKVVDDNVFYDCNESNINLVLEKLGDQFGSYNFIKTDFSNEVYISDRYYCLSNNNEKLYHILLKNIAYNVSYLGISKELNMQFYTDQKINNIDNLNSVFKIVNNNHIVKTDWLESLILDVFPFSNGELVKSFDIENYDSTCEILNTSENFPWQKLDKIGEMVLV